MMISPENFREKFMDKSYNTLLRERDNLIREIRIFEKDKDRYTNDTIIIPSPDVEYQMNLKYLGILCELIAEVYSQEAVYSANDQKEDCCNLLDHIDEIHTTELGVQRIKKILSHDVENVVVWCKEKIQLPHAVISKYGKNWYVKVDGIQLTINGTSYTIITATRKLKD